MLDFLHSLQVKKARIFSSPFGNLSCACVGEGWYPITSKYRNTIGAVWCICTYYSGGVLLSRNTYRSSGQKYMVRLWLIYGECVIIVDLPVIWLIILLKALLGAMRTLGVGCGVALRGLGRHLGKFLKKIIGLIRSC
jgi:hypothetical protein